MTFRLHATVKSLGSSFIPMITVRGVMGRMVGSYCPKGARLETSTFTSKLCAQICADQMAHKVATLRPDMFAVA
ncbi:hypothetical protein HU230_0012390 [Bradyrhizobium quebecense]|uniref:Uncharacterized protein n=1 Tax=Bradyrhizobium quebecense TaxID=2748629 RepID=A0A973WQX2_9BRAD|nr:hypothetical protein [Bradyrhizobium quebecense]UGA46787.1 hypothetical protein HU230_0012390 [Bradyrhizobium quebecense]